MQISSVYIRNKISHLIGLSLVLVIILIQIAGSQTPNLIEFNDQELWLSGSNVAWVDFARDLGPGQVQLSEFELAFKELRANGGNTMRLWLHTTGGHTPQWDGLIVTGPGQNAIQNLENILDLAESYDVALLLCLWSFDMLRITNGETITNRSKAILTQEENRQSYIDNSLIPMVESVKGHRAILAWEIFNEAEGMSEEFGWSITHHVPMSSIQAFVNQTAGAIKRTDPDAMVTTGTHTFLQISDIYTQDNPLHKNYYRDDRLIAAGSDADGILDFYTVHYYGSGDSPFRRNVDYFEVDKPLALGEFFIQGDIEGYAKDEIYKRLYDQGYAGALSWQWVDWRQSRENNEATWLNTLPNMQYMYSRHRDEVELSFSDKPISYTFTATETTIEAGFPTTLKWTSRDTETVTLNDEAAYVMDRIEVTPEETTEYILELKHKDGTSVRDTVTITVIPNLEVDRAYEAPRFTDEGNRWVYFDLKASYSIIKIITTFNTESPLAYQVQGSFDGVLWETWEEITYSGTNTDTIHFTEPNDGSFIRIFSEDPFDLEKISAYGLLSEIQPPRLSVTYPDDGDVFEPGRITFTAEVERGSGSFDGVYFHINDEEKAWRRFRPYAFNYNMTKPGDYTVRVEVRESNFPNFFSKPVNFKITEYIPRTRYEAEDADLSGTLTIQSHSGASGGKYIEMQDDGVITWPNVNVQDDGTYTIRIGYYLPYDHKTQYLEVNGERVGTILFPTPIGEWQYVEHEIDLKKGGNSISIVHYWGWMWFDYLDVLGEDDAVSVQEQNNLPLTHSLGINYPNPFNPQTTIPYEIAQPVHVIIEIFDVLGRRVKSFDKGVINAGRHQVTFNADKFVSGLYFYRLNAGGEIFTRRMMLIK